MKTINFILSALLLLCLIKKSSAQDCFVVYQVKGTIIIAETGKQLKAKDKVCSNESIIFKSADAVAIVHSTSKARYKIKLDKTKSSEFKDILQTEISNVLSKGTEKNESRPFTSDELLKNLDYYLGCLEILPDVDKYNIDSTCSFQVKYNFNGKSYAKELLFKGGIVYLFEQDILIQDVNSDKRIFPDGYGIYYSKNGSQKLLMNLHMSFLDSNEIKTEITPLINEMQSSNTDVIDILDSIYIYLNDVYGIIDLLNVRSWVMREFSL